MIIFNQNVCLRPYIGMNIDLRKKANTDFEKDLFKLINNTVFGNTIDDVRKHKNIKLVS